MLLFVLFGKNLFKFWIYALTFASIGKQDYVIASMSAMPQNLLTFISMAPSDIVSRTKVHSSIPLYFKYLYAMHWQPRWTDSWLHESYIQQEEMESKPVIT